MSGATTGLAFDLGAGSGRAVWGRLDRGRLETVEIARFANPPLRLGSHLHWNVFGLYEHMLAALRDATKRGPIDGVGVDTWGVDFALLARDGAVLGPPVAYRDARTDGAVESFSAKMSQSHVYEKTGIQTMPINTLYQLEAMVRDRSPLLDAATDLLMLPDLFHFWLTGHKTTEATIASTTQLLNIHDRAWDNELFDALGISTGLMQRLVEPGVVLGPLRADIAAGAHAPVGPVIAVATHDTASAVAAVPADGDDWMFISSGTWSLVGVESREPVVTAKSRAANITNEGGVDGTFRVLKNVMGLWLWQECRRVWNATDDAMSAAAADAPAFVSLIDPDDPTFLHPVDMPEAVRAFCRRTGQHIPETRGRIARCVLESLAIKYRITLDLLRETTGREINCVHVIGGGSLNEMLCRMTADATGLPAIAGPAEATAIGNLLVQAMATGHVATHAELRAVVRASISITRYEPAGSDDWIEPRQRVESWLKGESRDG